MERPNETPATRPSGSVLTLDNPTDGMRCTIQLLPMDVEAHFDDEEDLI